MRCRSMSSVGIDYLGLKAAKLAEFSKISEVRYREKFLQGLRALETDNSNATSTSKVSAPAAPDNVLVTTIESGMTTFLLHCEARIASSIGQGFYTIGKKTC